MAGFSHKKYAYYLLVLVIDLHLQSTAEYREAILSSMVASLSGSLGTHRPVDLLQEWLQRTLESVVRPKGQEFGASFIQNYVSRNLCELSILKEELLARDAECWILLEEYHFAELHFYHPGRQLIDSDDIIQTHFAAGVENFDLFLHKHLSRMAHMWDTYASSAMPSDSTGLDATTYTLPSDAVFDLESNDEEDIDDAIPIYFQTVSNGEITTEVVDVEADALTLIAMLVSNLDSDELE
ncbi:hypothetical protein F5878DRAFT_667680 [Lentinula raphanica]|uniref:DUF6589 domain-containing protein n=1 Tax=Lentinula raphanica TaxID=153919 RepID=A0AA38NVC7_9AGAR|nr:hypothetical protein F5878DRAFT_667680 [Lentinula raphanica]